MYQGRRLSVLGTVPALVVMGMLLACKVASAAGANPVFSYPNGFSGATGAFQTAANAASFSGATMQVTSGGPGRHEAGGVWYKTQQNITSFTTNFTFRIADTGAIPSTVGMTFCIQNSNTTTNPSAPWGLQSGIYAVADANMAGYGTYSNESETMAGVGKSVAIKFDISSNNGQGVIYPPGGAPNATGLYINGGPMARWFPRLISIRLESTLLGHVMAATIVYDGSILTMTLRIRRQMPSSGRVGRSIFRRLWGATLPGSALPAARSLRPQNILTWSFSEGYNAKLATPTFSATPGQYRPRNRIALWACRRDDLLHDQRETTHELIK